jgi:adenylate cyclase
MEREASFEPRAILVADMVGYSRWLAQQPVATYAAFTSHVRHVFEPAMREHAGKIVKTTGDGAAVTLQTLIQVPAP